MHFNPTRILTLLTSLLSLTTPAWTQYTTRSHAFNLVLESSNKTLNGVHLTACHSGAAIESLCTFPSASDSASAEFYYNYSTAVTPKSGIITWNETANNGAIVFSEPLTWSYDPSTNVAMPVFFPTTNNEIQVDFDADNYLRVIDYLVDTTTPPTSRLQYLQRWLICQTYYGGYSYTTLAWVLGTGKPQNPSCQAVKVKRQAITH